MDSRNRPALSRPRRLAGTTAALVVLLAVSFGAALAQPPPPERPERVISRAPLDLQDAVLFDRQRVTFVKALEDEGTREIRTGEELRAIPAGTLLVARLEEPGVLRPVEAAGRLRFDLPYRMGVAGAQGTGDLGLHAVAFVDRGGLRFVPERNRFEGSVVVGLENVNDPAAPRQDLPDGVDFQFLFSAGTAVPDQLTIAHTNLPHSRVDLTAGSIPVSPTLTVMVSSDPRRDILDIPVVRPRADIMAPASLPGLGFGRGVVTVQIPPELAGIVTEVTLHPELGQLDPLDVPLSASGVGSAELRSARIGTARISLVGGVLEADPVTVEFLWPWFLSIAILAGAAAGGGLAHLAKKSFPAYVLIGIVVGVAFCGGIRLTEVDLGNHVTEAAAFVAAALAGFLIWMPSKLGWTKTA